jgi:hypothetical protein
MNSLHDIGSWIGQRIGGSVSRAARSVSVALLAGPLLGLFPHGAAEAESLLRAPCPAGYAYQCTGASCACVAGQTVYVGTGTDPLDLIWDVADGTASQGATGGTELLIIITPKIVRPDSSCQVIATAQFHDLAGNLLKKESNTLTPATPYWVVAQPPVNAGALRKRFRASARGSASGCTADELLGLAALLTTTDSESGEIVSQSLLRPTLTFVPGGLPTIIPDHVFPPAARGVSRVLSNPCAEGYAYQCTGASCACVAGQTVYKGPSTSPSDLIWDIDGGTANRSGQTLELVLSGAPWLPGSECRADLVVELSELGGNTLLTQTASLSAASPSLVVEWPNPSSEVVPKQVQAKIQGVANGCLIDEIRRWGLRVATYDSASGKTAASRLAGRPLVIVAEGEAEHPLPILPPYSFPPGLRLGETD